MPQPLRAPAGLYSFLPCPARFAVRADIACPVRRYSLLPFPLGIGGKVPLPLRAPAGLYSLRHWVPLGIGGRTQRLPLWGSWHDEVVSERANPRLQFRTRLQSPHRTNSQLTIYNLPSRCAPSETHLKITASCFGAFIILNCTAEWSRPFPTSVGKIGWMRTLPPGILSKQLIALSVWLVPRQPALPKGEPWNGAYTVTWSICGSALRPLSHFR